MNSVGAGGQRALSSKEQAVFEKEKHESTSVGALEACALMQQQQRSSNNKQLGVVPFRRQEKKLLVKSQGICILQRMLTQRALSFEAALSVQSSGSSQGFAVQPVSPPAKQRGALAFDEKRINTGTRGRLHV